MSLVTFLKFHLHFNYTDLEIIKNLCLTLHFRSNYRLQLLLISQESTLYPHGRVIMLHCNSLLDT